MEKEKLKHKKKENLVYAASRALWKTEKKSERKIGALTRIIRCASQTGKARRDMRGKSYYTAEKRRKVYRDIFADTCSPVYNAWIELWDTAYGFVARFFSDLKGLFIDIVNVFITIGYYLKSVLLYVTDWIADIAYWCEGRKRALLGVFTTLTATAVAVVLFLTSITAYEYSYYGRVLGLAKSEKLVYDTIEVIGDKLAENVGANVTINVERDIEFRKVRGFGLKLDGADDILNTLTYMKDLQVDAYAICVDGVQKVIVENDEVAKELLANIKTDFAGERPGVEYTDIHYEKPVTIEGATVKLGEIWNSSEAEKYLKTGIIKEVWHTVESGESAAEIAAMYGVSESQLAAANPDIDLENLEAGTELSLSEKDPVITIASTEIATYLTDVEFGNQYIDNGSLYQGEEEIKTPGILGKDEVVATVERVNGEEVSRTIMSTTRVSDPVDAVVYRGTKQIPERIGTGNFMRPIRSYYLSSHMGVRWGRMHEGVDLAAPTGTKIYAADGGVCTFSGWQNGLGYVVYIDHGGLFKTVYGHCSKLLVEAGDEIYQGQNIALVGSTGNSTGSHLHFEVRYNGQAMNPEDYVAF